MSQKVGCLYHSILDLDPKVNKLCDQDGMCINLMEGKLSTILQVRQRLGLVAAPPPATSADLVTWPSVAREERGNAKHKFHRPPMNPAADRFHRFSICLCSVQCWVPRKQASKQTVTGHTAPPPRMGGLLPWRCDQVAAALAGHGVKACSSEGEWPVCGAMPCWVAIVSGVRGFVGGGRRKTESRRLGHHLVDRERDCR